MCASFYLSLFPFFPHTVIISGGKLEATLMFMLPTVILLVTIADVVTGPPLPTKEVMDLIEKTGDDSFQVREKATADLEKMGWKALRALEKATRNKDPEIAVRARRSVAKYYSVYADDK